MLDRHSSIPLYKQIANDLIDRINNREYKPNERIPTEQSLLEKYSVSRLTVRRALNILEEANLISIIQGKGMFVKNSTIEMNLDELRGFNQMLSEQELDYSSKLLGVERTFAPEEVCKALQISQDEETFNINKLYIVDERPIAVLKTYLSPDLNLTDDLQEFLADSTLLELFEEKFNLELKEARYSIEAKPTTYEVSEILNVSLGYPLLLVSRITQNDKDKVVEMTYMYLCSDAYQFKFTIKKGNKLVDNLHSFPQELIIRT